MQSASLEQAAHPSAAGQSSAQPPAAIERALISVSDKTGLAELARCLAAAKVQILSTGGTRKFLLDQGFAVEDLSSYTGMPEMMDGRVKTLHPKVHGGILSRRDHDEDQAAMREHGFQPIDLVVVNLYPFEATVAKPGVSDPEAIEQIDIGGPSLIRGAAKNHAWVAVCTGADQYPALIEQISKTGGTTLELRRKLAGEAFARTGLYDQAIADYFARPQAEGPFPATLRLSFRRQEVLRYGENPHQQAAVFTEMTPAPGTLVTAQQLNGKELSYNNLLDLEAALAIVRGLPNPAAAVIKHNNPCGAASAGTLAEAARQALDGDPVSAFGSVLGFNRTVDAATAEVLVEPGRFIEAIVAPRFDPAALEVLTTRPKWKANVRLMQLAEVGVEQASWEYRRISGGLLMQTADVLADPENEWRVVTTAQPTEQQWSELRFVWALVRQVKSNAIALSNGHALCGVGAGQMSRVDSVNIAIEKAGPRAQGAAVGSDAFFPFADSIDLLAAAKVAAVIQPGGSRNDDEVIAACNKHGIPMVFTGRRHFKH
jgi:phosphoribosylaminoimidazolecarboxamide formyltransferase/IMP cyclohydrolase